MRVFKKKTVLAIVPVIIAGLICWSGGVASSAESVSFASLPFQPGERLVYNLRWGIIPAGYAELQVLPFATVNGEEAWHFIMSVQTTEFVDLFYKVRDRIETFTDLSMTNSLLYKKEQREGSTDRDVVIRFDWDSNSAVYSNKGEVREPIAIETGTLDPLASLYYIRTQSLADKLEVVKPVTDGKKVVRGVARIIGRETLNIDGTEYNTFMIEPDLKDVRGVFEKSDESKLRLWITDDDRRLLVKVKSKVVVGSFTGTLVEATLP